MTTTYEKVSETEYKKIIPQEPIEEVTTLDTLLVDEASIAAGLENNKSQVVYLTNALAEIRVQIATVRALGVKTQDEVIQEEPIPEEPIETPE